jgi:FSR family fosmidomycin resistance protein-like MFS transporter
MTPAIATAEISGAPSVAQRRGALLVCGGAHILHDGLSNLPYILLPIWQGQFGLSLAEIGFLKTVYSGCLAGLQVPSGYAAERLGEGRLLALGTALAGLGFLLAGWAGGFLVIALCLALSGGGSSVQHPISSSLIARAFERAGVRNAISAYNFAGDLGKVAVPALAAWLIASAGWRATSQAIGAGALLAALAMIWLLGSLGRARHAPAASEAAPAPAPATWAPRARRGFIALSTIGVIDSATRGGFLVFLPFLLGAKGASLPTVGLAMSLVFAGGATGKFVCGVIANQVGILRTVILTEAATAAAIVALLPLSLTPALALLPLLGLALNGTSSVLYGTVAELVPAARRARAFGLFYTVTIGASAAAPSIYGALSDHIGMSPTLVVVAVFVLLVIPFTLPLRGALHDGRSG